MKKEKLVIRVCSLITFYFFAWSIDHYVTQGKCWFFLLIAAASAFMTWLYAWRIPKEIEKEDTLFTLRYNNWNIMKGNKDEEVSWTFDNNKTPLN